MLQTALHDWHAAHQARMVDFAGWHMPVQYASIVREHNAVRQAVGLFDIAHMGRLRFTGPEACAFLDRLLTNDVTALAPGDIRYGLVTNEAGGILDDVLVYRFPSSYLLVVNASNRLKIVDWIAQQKNRADTHVDDETERTVMLALQGPRAIDVLQPNCEAGLSGMKYYTGCETRVFGRAAVVSRTGYTGEDGFEIIVPTAEALAVWESLVAAGASAGLEPCGLGARDTLRLEAAMPLYGHELDEATDPLTAGLGHSVKLTKPEFIGKQALERIKAAAPKARRVGLALTGKRVAREGAAVIEEGRPVGKVTSGTFSPTLEIPIAMAYVEPESAPIGTPLEVDIRGTSVPATVVKLPFYSRKRSG